jgi:hypothetical protein
MPTDSALVPSPACPRCGHPMQLGRVLPDSFGPELRTYVCQQCHEVITVAVLDDECDCPS